MLCRVIIKGAGGGLGSGASGSSRGTIVSSVLELHKDEEIYFIVGQNGEHACVKTMGIPDPACMTTNKKFSELSKTHFNFKLKALTETSFENGGGGGGGGSYVFLVRSLLVCR
jgi:anaplastic lymphoma kinase